MTELHAAAVTLARTLTAGGTVFRISTSGGEPVATAIGDTPVVALSETSAEASLRTRSRPGDTVIIIGNPEGRDRILRRCPAWGIASVWVGETRRPEPGLASVCLLVEDTAACIGELHPAASLLIGDTVALLPAIVDCTDEVCITCSDEGRLGEVISWDGGFDPARMRTALGDEDVDVTLVGDVEPGDLVLIHAGSAFTRIHDTARESSER